MAGQRTKAPAWIEKEKHKVAQRIANSPDWSEEDDCDGADLLEEIANSGVKFAVDVLGLKTSKEIPNGITEQQVQIVDALRDNKRVAVRSANGIGKTFLAGLIALHFGTTRESLVITTAPTAEHVKTKLWGEIRGLHENSAVPLGGELLTTRLKMGPKWEIIGLSTKNPNNFQGGHADHILIIFDECQDITQVIWDAAESMMMGYNARWLVIGNPLDARGPFYKCFQRRSEWFPITLSALDHPNYIHRREIIKGATTYEWCEEKRLIWGERDPRYFARVLGQFPVSGSDRVVPLGFLEECNDLTDTHPDPDDGIHLGIDVARYGTDESVICVLRDGLLLEEIRLSSMNGQEIAGAVVRAALEHGLTKKDGKERLHVDEIGVGASVVDFLNDMKWGCDPVNFAAAPRGMWSELDGGQEYLNLRAECYWAVRERLRNHTLIIPDDFGETWEELSEPGYTFPRGKLKIEEKDAIKKRISRSPDGADAVALAQARRMNRRVGVIVG